jgi:hypothetical protein
MAEENKPPSRTHILHFRDGTIKRETGVLTTTDNWVTIEKDWGTDVSYNRDDITKFETESSCFIATAVYGDTNAPEVLTLRALRDEVLNESRLGRRVVDLYYSGLGEKAANFIEDHAQFTMPAIRKGLDFLVRKYESRKNPGYAV